jgi:hypothetical protein
LVVIGVVFATHFTAGDLFAALQIGPQNLGETFGARRLGGRIWRFLLLRTIVHAKSGGRAIQRRWSCGLISRAWLSALPPVKACGSVPPLAEAGTLRVGFVGALAFSRGQSLVPSCPYRLP